jgi:hypothetical protein
MITVATQQPDTLPFSHACEALELNRSTIYAWRWRAVNDEKPKRSRQDTVLSHTRASDCH